MKDSQNIIITLAHERDDEDWEFICDIITNKLGEMGFEPLVVVIQWMANKE